MKHLKKLFCVMVSLVSMISTTTVQAVSPNLSSYDSAIINMADTYADSTAYANIDLNPFTQANGGRYFTVKEPEKDHFEVDVNGTPMTVIISQNNSVEDFEPRNIFELDSENIIDIIESSQEKIEDYIDESSILKDKDGIKNYILSLDIKEAEFTDNPNVGAYFSETDSMIYINRDNSNYVCEWMVSHEYMHAIAFYTHGEKELDDVPYAYSLYNEVWTDLLTCSLEPSINESVESYYKAYYALIYPYINIFNEDSIEAYFYGYDFIYSKISKPELDFFVAVLENFGEENSEVYYNNLTWKWYATNLS